MDQRAVGRRENELLRQPYRVLLVCTGNLARSPAAELLLAQRLTPAAHVDVASAGVQAVDGAVMAAPMAALLGPVGVRTDDFRSRQLSADMVRDAALILTATRRHRSIVVTLDPAAVRRTFTILEFARLAEMAGTAAEDPEHGHRLTDQIQELAKSRRAPIDPAVDDLEDPYGRSAKYYQVCYTQTRRSHRRHRATATCLCRDRHRQIGVGSVLTNGRVAT